MRIRLTVIMTLVGLLFQARAKGQNEIEALRYSSAEPARSARSLGMNGAYSAVGADLSSYFGNPAGIGVYKRTSMEAALSHDNHLITTSYTGEENKHLKSRLNLANAGFTATRSTRNPRIKSINYGVAYAKTNNFYQSFTIEGEAETSLMQQFALQANGIAPDELYTTLPFSAGPAYDVYGIDPADESGSYYVPATSGLARQRKQVTREGRQSETSIAIATNLDDNLYLGVSINVVGVYFSEISDYSENYSAENRVNEVSFNEDLVTSATGFAAQFGILYKVNDNIRLSASHRSKTAMYLQDIYSTSASSKLGFLSYFSESPELLSDYILRLPARSTFGVAGVIGKYGMLTLDLERSDFSTVKMQGTAENSYNYAAENELFQAIFRPSTAVRFGLESRILSTYYARAGYGIMRNPLSDDAGALNAPLHSVAFGLGYRDDHFFADLALRTSMTRSTYFLYDPALVQPASLQDKVTQVMLSAGFRF
ncbi:MAG: OmpP1/FadL family transporter [Flavobacteriales bacterium]|jgi:hypothetical protein